MVGALWQSILGIVRTYVRIIVDKLRRVSMLLYLPGFGFVSLNPETLNLKPLKNAGSNSSRSRITTRAWFGETCLRTFGIRL